MNEEYEKRIIHFSLFSNRFVDLIKAIKERKIHYSFIGISKVDYLKKKNPLITNIRLICGLQKAVMIKIIHFTFD